MQDIFFECLELSDGNISKLCENMKCVLYNTCFSSEPGFFLHVVEQPNSKTSPGAETCLRNQCFHSPQSHLCETFIYVRASR